MYIFVCNICNILMCFSYLPCMYSPQNCHSHLLERAEYFNKKKIILFFICSVKNYNFIIYVWIRNIFVCVELYFPQNIYFLKFWQHFFLEKTSQIKYQFCFIFYAINCSWKGVGDNDIMHVNNGENSQYWIYLQNVGEKWLTLDKNKINIYMRKPIIVLMRLENTFLSISIFLGEIKCRVESDGSKFTTYYMS